ncbi:hypothetical protein ACOT7R_09140 [Clostridium perfringens]|uniref:hypothetical protein n=1 Tax=Clostridium perfringens TaxID=1502 RepID=UPI003BA9060F
MKISNNIKRCINCNGTDLEFNDNSIDKVINPNKGYADIFPIKKCMNCGSYHYLEMDHEDKLTLILAETKDIEEDRMDLWKWGR